MPLAIRPHVSKVITTLATLSRFMHDVLSDVHRLVPSMMDIGKRKDVLGPWLVLLHFAIAAPCMAMHIQPRTVFGDIQS